jgi:nicotinamide mononucleotide transporter
LKSFIQQECSGWKKAEIIWLVFCSVSIILLSIQMRDNLLGIVSALTGTWYALWAGKGKISCYFFGIINSFGYGLISYKYNLYGELMLNWGYYLPMMFVGIFCWKNHLNKQSEIKKVILSWRGKIVLIIVCIAGIIMYGAFLKIIGGRTPGLDSLTTVLSIAAMVMTVKRCVEQWILWIIVNACSVIMWLNVFLQEGGVIATLLMWCIALANGIIFYIQWTKEVKKANG